MAGGGRWVGEREACLCLKKEGVKEGRRVRGCWSGRRRRGAEARKSRC